MFIANSGPSTPRLSFSSSLLRSFVSRHLRTFERGAPRAASLDGVFSLVQDTDFAQRMRSSVPKVRKLYVPSVSVMAVGFHESSPRIFTLPHARLPYRIAELRAIGNSDSALKLLQSILTVRRHRTWTKLHEPIIKELLSICVETRNSAATKDGLHQYRNISQHVRLTIARTATLPNGKPGVLRHTTRTQAQKSGK